MAKTAAMAVMGVLEDGKVNASIQGNFDNLSPEELGSMVGLMDDGVQRLRGMLKRRLEKEQPHRAARFERAYGATLRQKKTYSDADIHVNHHGEGDEPGPTY